MRTFGRPARARRARARASAAEIEVAVLLVASGAARSVRLAGLPLAARLAAPTRAHAERLGVQLEVERSATQSVVLRFSRREAP